MQVKQVCDCVLAAVAYGYPTGGGRYTSPEMTLVRVTDKFLHDFSNILSRFNFFYLLVMIKLERLVFPADWYLPLVWQSAHCRPGLVLQSV